MPDFSIILAAPQVRPLVQQNLLERAFHDALFPQLLYRGEATPQVWPAGVGDVQIFSAPGLIEPDLTPGTPGVDPSPVSYPMEQWQAQLHQYHGTIDTHMPTSMVAIADLFLRNSHQLGLQAGMTVNRLARNRLYNAALSGWTVADGAQVGVTELRVKRLNGLTRARNPLTSGASRVQFDTVSSSNPLQVHIDVSGVDTLRNVIGYTPDTIGDEVGPGTITINSAITVADRAYVYSADATNIVRSGGGLKVDDVAGDSPSFADLRKVVANFRENNVPAHPDGRYHAHLGPQSENLIFSDDELQRLNTAIPDYYMYKQFAIGETLGTIYVRNSEAPIVSTVVDGSTGEFSQRDPFGGELTVDGTVGGERAHRILFTAQGGLMEYYSDLANLLTDAGVQGKIAEPQVVNNGIEVYTDRIQLIIRSPQNRMADMVSTSWKIIADWPFRTDAATGDSARYKRAAVIEHGDA